MKTTATTLPLEQQQKLCIARLLPLKPEVILMDEPCSALDAEGDRAIEELMCALRGRYTIVIVTHNMAQARRASDECIFMLLGELIEHRRTEDLFLDAERRAHDELHRGPIRLAPRVGETAVRFPRWEDRATAHCRAPPKAIDDAAHRAADALPPDSHTW